jgi:hypothetical protein
MNVSAQSLLIQERDSRSSFDKRAPVKFRGAPFNVHEFLLRKSNSRKILRALSLQNNQNNDQFYGNPISSLHGCNTSWLDSSKIQTGRNFGWA